MKKIRRIDWTLVIAIVLMISGCGGGCGGCDGMEPIPGGFPAGKRTSEAVQVRVSPTALGKITADPAGILGPLLGNSTNGVIQFPFPPGGPLEIDLGLRVNDEPRLVLTPVAGAGRLDITIRARVRTVTPLKVEVISGTTCDITLNTAPGAKPDLRIDTHIAFTQDPTTGTTRIEASNTQVTQLDGADFSIGGAGLCLIGNIIPAGTLQDQLEGPIQDAINDATCKSCDSGQVAECGSSFATACTDKVCQVGSRCLQETGLTGRMRGSGIFGSFSPGTTGALDLYEVLGGYARTDNNGISLGMLGGMQPGGADRDRCGPRGTEPALVNIDELPMLQGNVRTDVTPNQPFDVAIGLHKSQLDQFAYAGYDGGFLCLTIGNATVSQLTTDTLSLLSRSLADLVDGSAPMSLGLRPQKQPTIVLGKNTFMDDGQGGQVLMEPLLDITFEKMEIDFFTSIDDQYTRVFTLVTDVHLPIGLQTAGMGEIVPVIGSVDNAFTNVSVKNSEAVKETPEQLAATFPQILGLVLPQLSGGLGSFQLPSIGGLNLSVTAITSIDNNNFMAIFANLVTASTRTVDTSVTLAGIEEPAAEIARNPKRWHGSRGPAVTLDLGDAQDLEWSYRTDHGAWSVWSKNRHPRVAPGTFWLPGEHKIEVRAREIGKPETMDPTPELVEVILGTDVETSTTARVPFHGQPSSAGCACDSSGNGGGAGVFALFVLAMLLPMRRIGRRMIRRVTRSMKRTGLIVWAATIALLPGCSCGNDAPCGDVDCEPGETENGGIGRYTSIAGDNERVLVATYDNGLGDLVVADVTDPDKITLVAVDGIPDITPIHDPSTYRGGVSGDEVGPNVGTWTSIALHTSLGRVSYYDRDETALKFAYEEKKGSWKSYTLDPSDDGEDVGTHTSIAIDANGHPAVAYIAQGIDDGQGHRTTELRLARSGVVAPEDSGDWNISLIAQAPGSCAGICGAGQACIAGAAVGDPQTCTATTSDCTSTCDTGTACIGGACVDALVAPVTSVLASGTGLFVSLVVLPDGRLAATYYDRSTRALKLAIESSVDTSNFMEVTLDATASRDNGMWSSAVVDGAGTIHVAYQDSIGDQLMYTTWNGAPGTPEVVDDGQRTGDRPHTVGASASIYLVNGTPSIAYHDGLTSDVYVAAKGTPWSTMNVASGALLDGISVDAASGPGGTYLAWDSIDPQTSPLHHLVVKRQ